MARSDFLGGAYRDGAGLVADFHSLRHQYVSRIVETAASPKVAQELARHCDVGLTLGRYVHAALHDLTAAVDSFPSMLSRPAPESAALAATGTDGRENPLGSYLGPQTAISGHFARQAETEHASAG
jgi:hypothetical protein